MSHRDNCYLCCRLLFAYRMHEYMREPARQGAAFFVRQPVGLSALPTGDAHSPL